MSDDTMFAITRTGYRSISSGDELMDGETLSETIPSELMDFTLKARCRIQRDGMLRVCDWTQVSDAPLDSFQKTQWSAYRQALRDVPNQQGFPYDITWPTPPSLPAGTSITKGLS